MARGAAGGRAQDKYVALTKAWRKRKRKLFLAITAFCSLVFVFSVVGWHVWPRFGFVFGLWAGSVFSFWLMIRESPPAWIEQWQQGAFGEQATAKKLRALEREGWMVLHDLPRGIGNVDHVVVGPGGVFVLDSKRTDGQVVVDDQGRVTVTRLDDPNLHYTHAGAAHVRRLARETHDRVAESSRLSVWVTPVVVWWAAFPQRVAEGSCVQVHGEDLVAWLRSRPLQIAPNRLDRVVEEVRAAWLPAHPQDPVESGRDA